VALLREAAPLHDVGKLAISDVILPKPGPLTPEELEEMKTHTTRGARLLSGSNSPVLQMGRSSPGAITSAGTAPATRR
jgi:putative two-component system response regulator